MTEIPDHLLKRATAAAKIVRGDGYDPVAEATNIEAGDFNRNEVVVRGEAETMFPKFGTVAQPFGPTTWRGLSVMLPPALPDNPFRNYTPFPKLDAAERKARAAAIEGRERLVAAWKVLRDGDRDPFGEGCDCW